MSLRQPRRPRTEWQALVQAQASSSQSATAFCASHGVAYTNFLRWRKILSSEPSAQADSTPTFVELTDAMRGDGASDDDPGNWRVELDLGGGIQLRIA